MINKKSIGILYIVLSAFCFACMSLFVRLSGDLPSIQKSFFRNLIAFIFAVSIIWKNRVPVRIPKDSILPLILRSAAGTIGIFCNFYAVDHLPVADLHVIIRRRLRGKRRKFSKNRRFRDASRRKRAE